MPPHIVSSLQWNSPHGGEIRLQEDGALSLGLHEEDALSHWTDYIYVYI